MGRTARTILHRGCAACLLVAALAAGAAAADLHGRSSTQLLWYNEYADGSKQADLAQYLRVSVTGFGSMPGLSISGYGRLVLDAKGDSLGDDKLQERLYYLYADLKAVLGAADLRVGRQFVNLSAGSALVDGVQVDVAGTGPVGFAVLGGRNVLFGDRGMLASHYMSWGATAYLKGVEKTYLDISYFRTYDYDDVARDIIGASYKQYFLESIKAYANARYDLTAEVFNELLGGVKYFPLLDLMLTAEHFESYPTFDATSIYSVFAVDQFKQNLARAEYTITSWFDMSLGYSGEAFGEGARARVLEGGVKLRPSVNAIIGIYSDRRNGYPGDLSGYRVFGELREPGKWTAAVGVDRDVYERDPLTGRETARKYWAGGRYFMSKDLSASARIENNVNINYNRDLQGRITVDVDF